MTGKSNQTHYLVVENQSTLPQASSISENMDLEQQKHDPIQQGFKT